MYNVYVSSYLFSKGKLVKRTLKNVRCDCIETGGKHLKQ